MAPTITLEGSRSGKRPVEPKLKKVVTLDLDTNNKKDRDRDYKIPDIKVESKVSIIRIAKVAVLPKFLGELERLNEFIAKSKIYFNYNVNSFLTESD